MADKELERVQRGGRRLLDGLRGLAEGKKKKSGSRGSSSLDSSDGSEKRIAAHRKRMKKTRPPGYGR